MLCIVLELDFGPNCVLDSIEIATFESPTDSFVNRQRSHPHPLLKLMQRHSSFIIVIDFYFVVILNVPLLISLYSKEPKKKSQAEEEVRYSLPREKQEREATITGTGD